MITITRDVARQVRAVFRRALNASRGRIPLVWFTSGAEGLHIRAKLGGAAVEYHEPGERASDHIVLPMDFLAKLPGSEEYGWAVTLDLDQIPAVRARAESRSKPTELVLVNSNCQGEAVRLTSDRRYLQFALRLGLRQVYFYGPQGAILARDESRSYMWMPLAPSLAVKPSPDAVRIESTQADPLASRLPSKLRKRCQPRQPSELQHERTLRIMPDKRHHADTGQAAEPQPVTQADPTEAHSASRSPVELATELRDQLRQTVASASELLAALKQQQKQTRLVHATLDSLKQLQRAAG